MPFVVPFSRHEEHEVHEEEPRRKPRSTASSRGKTLMSADPVISVENLGKSYLIRHQAGGAGYRRFSEELVETLARPIRALRSLRRPNGAPPPTALPPSKERFWALKDVSFEVKRGEVLGIIGRNGAGKSTLLKILSRITEPTEGRVRIRGRVASLLEVGTGFHPELTGRENIFLNGTILGMTRREIQKKFDEIVAFAEVEKFLDTPVKRYSSGMYVRLAFAVAAHLEPEILVVDEVLAVGDAQFQKRCLGKMKDVASQGRTVLFVSHNMGAVTNLCTRALTLQQGSIVFDGETHEAISQYSRSGGESSGSRRWVDLPRAPGDDRVRLVEVRCRSGGDVSGDIAIDKPVNLEIVYDVLKEGLSPSPSIHLIDKMGCEVLATANMPSATLNNDRWYGRPFPKGRYCSSCTIPGNFLNEGLYSIRVILVLNGSEFPVFEREALSFMVYETGEMRREYQGQWLGAVRPRLEWSTHPAHEAAHNEGLLR